MCRREIHKVGSLLKDRWIIVSILKQNGVNKKILCYDTNNGNFVEGWICNFISGVQNNRTTRKNSCVICEMNYSDLPKDVLFDLNADSVFGQYIKTKNLTNADLVELRDIREGMRFVPTDILEYFGKLLAKTGQARRNKGLATVIGTTYEILYRKNLLN